MDVSRVGCRSVDFQQTGLAGAAPLSTGANPVDTGSYYVSESGGLANYDGALRSEERRVGKGGSAHNGIKDGNEPTVSPDANNGVAVGQGDVVVCTFTNTRKRGSIELCKVWSSAYGQLA